MPIRHVKKAIRNFYRSLPFKRSIVYSMRALGGGHWLPEGIKSYLVFEGEFEVRLVGESRSFAMMNGYGREIEASCFWDGLEAFEKDTVNLWCKLSQYASVIFDVGANTGIYSLVAKAVNPGAKVYAFEPLSRIYSVLERNVVLNDDRWQGAPRIVANRMALSDYDGTGAMYDLPVEHMYTASLNRNVHMERCNPVAALTERVEVMRMERFCASHEIIPDLIKIDVESHEPAVLRGMGDLLKRHQPTIICEIWNNDVGAEVEAALEGNGYRYFAIGDVITEKPHVRNEKPEDGYINYLFISNSHLEILKTLDRAAIWGRFG